MTRKRFWTTGGLMRSGMLFTNFFLIIMALYQLKPVSRSLILETHGVKALPYVWIGSALTLLAGIAIYHHVLNRFTRLRVVLGTCVTFIVILLLFWISFITPTRTASAAFYIFVDLFGVVLVEQFWSLTNSIHTTIQGKRWYGLVGTGGLAGGMVGGALAGAMIRYTPLQTPDLLLVAVGILAIILGLTWMMAHFRLYARAEAIALEHRNQRNWRTLTRSRYLALIAAGLLMAQLVSPLVEYQFMGVVEKRYPELELRTAILSSFFSVLSAVAIGVNLVFTPMLLRTLGVLGGLLAQPLVLLAASYGFWLQPTFYPAAAMKISDRGLSYSINRAAKELLYIPVAPVVMYQAKAWIDMFGYRIFKVLGSVLILALTQWSMLIRNELDLTWIVIGGCMVWLALLVWLYRHYRALVRGMALAAGERSW